MNRITNIIIALAIFHLIAIETGCSSIGREFDFANAKRIKNGMSREEVIEIMGSEPDNIEGDDPGKLVWLSSSSTSFTLNMRRVRLNLDENGKVYGIPKEGIEESSNFDNY
jgi:hypothetical protein